MTTAIPTDAEVMEGVHAANAAYDALPDPLRELPDVREAGPPPPPADAIAQPTARSLLAELLDPNGTTVVVVAKLMTLLFLPLALLAAIAVGLWLLLGPDVATGYVLLLWTALVIVGCAFTLQAHLEPS
jgi:hypothetical protein